MGGVGAPGYVSQSVACPASESVGEASGSRFRQRRRKLRARVDSELAVDAREVDLDCPLSDEERLRDLAIRRPLGSDLGDAPLARRE